MPWASAAAQTRGARASLTAWRASAGELVCSWARLEGDAHRSQSPLLAHLPDRVEFVPRRSAAPLAVELHKPALESLDDTQGVAVDISRTVAGGVKPLALQAECGFHAYGEMRLEAEALETPAPGIDARERGMLMHKALELVWLKLGNHFRISVTETAILRPTIADSVAAAVVVRVSRAMCRSSCGKRSSAKRTGSEILIEKLLDVERTRAPFTVENSGSAPRGRHRRRSVRTAHRSHRCH